MMSLNIAFLFQRSACRCETHRGVTGSQPHGPTHRPGEPASRPPARPTTAWSRRSSCLPPLTLPHLYHDVPRDLAALLRLELIGHVTGGSLRSAAATILQAAIRSVSKRSST